MKAFSTLINSRTAPNRTCFQLAFSLLLFLPISGCEETSFHAPNGQNSATPVDAVVVFGDSLTCGGQGNTYGQSPVGSLPAALQSLLDIPVVNQGVSGDSSSQIAVRYNAGGSNQVLTLSGDQTISSAPVQVSFVQGWEPVISSGGNNGANCYLSLKGSGTNGVINGVSGVFTYSKRDYYFTPSVAQSSPVSTKANNAYTVASPYAGYFLIDSSGTNDVALGTSLTTSIDNDIAMASLAGKRYIITSALPFDRPAYMPGQDSAVALLILNSVKASVFGTHYVDTLKPLLGGCGPTSGSTIAALDALDVANEIVPTSCHAYSAGKILANISPAQTSICVTGAVPAAGEKGYLGHSPVPSGNPEAILITDVQSPGSCSSGSQLTVVRGYAGTTPGSYTASQDSWGFWDRVHLSGGAPNTSIAARTGYSIQAAAIQTAYRKLTTSAAQK